MDPVGKILGYEKLEYMNYIKNKRKLTDSEVNKLFEIEPGLYNPSYPRKTIYKDNKKEIYLLKIKVKGVSYICKTSPNTDKYPEEWYKDSK